MIFLIFLYTNRNVFNIFGIYNFHSPSIPVRRRPIPQNGAIPRRPGLSKWSHPPNPFPSTINFPFSHCSNAPPSLLTATPPHGFKTKCASLCNQSAQLTECSNIYNSLSLQETLLSKFCNKIISISGQNFKITERGRFAFLFPTIKLSVTQRTSSHKKCHKKLVSQKIVVPKNGCYKKMGVTKMGVTKK